MGTLLHQVKIVNSCNVQCTLCRTFFASEIFSCGTCYHSCLLTMLASSFHYDTPLTIWSHPILTRLINLVKNFSVSEQSRCWLKRWPSQCRLRNVAAFVSYLTGNLWDELCQENQSGRINSFMRNSAQNSKMCLLHIFGKYSEWLCDKTSQATLSPLCTASPDY